MPIAPPERPDRTALMILTDPPPTPACYESRESWQLYLLSMWESGEKLTRVVDNKRKPDLPRLQRKFIPIDHCRDCEVGGQFQQRMQACGRCIPFTGPTQDDQRESSSKALVRLVTFVPEEVRAKCAERGTEWVRQTLTESALADE